MPTTVVPLKHPAGQPTGLSDRGTDVITAADQARAATGEGIKSALSGILVHVTSPPSPSETKEAIANEARKGFDLLWVGIEPVLSAVGAIHDDVKTATAGFGGHFAVVSAQGALVPSLDADPLAILLAINGTAYSRRAAEIALALAQASGGTVTALYAERANAFQKLRDTFDVARRRLRPGTAAIREVVELGGHYNIDVKTQVKYERDAARAILQALKDGPFGLLVMGVTARSADAIFFGPVPAAVLDGSPKPLLLIAT